MTRTTADQPAQRHAAAIVPVPPFAGIVASVIGTMFVPVM
ncbi:hypothetical protein EDD92_0857 [Streptomyces sp. TLI_185]|nr:hypothetical protein EDD92_0857 [Streptomyces sp. TLI_185]